MNAPNFDAFFSRATSLPGESRAPYDYQRRLAGGDSGRACESQLISIPTGLGKNYNHFEFFQNSTSTQSNS